MNKDDKQSNSKAGSISYWENRFIQKSEKVLIDELEQDIKNVKNSFSAEILQREIDRLSRN